MRAGKENGFLLPSAAGTNGQVLTYNSTGTLGWSTPLAIAGDSGDLQFNNNGSLGGAQFVNAENGYLKLVTGLPNSAAAGGVVMGAKDMAGRVMPGWVGLDSTAQANLGFNRAVQIVPVAGTTTPTLIGQTLTVNTNSTATARTPTATNYFTSLARTGYVGSANLSGSIAGFRTGLQWWRGGSITNAGGFFYTCTFGLTNASAQASGRAFVGLYASTSVSTNVEATTMVNAIGMCRSTTSNNWMIYGANGTANSTLVDLGSNYPAGTISSDFYRLVLFAPPGGSTVGWKVTRLNAIDSTTNQPFTTSGVITNSAQMPVSTVFLAAYGWSSTGTLTGTAGIDLIGLYVETDN
jgi:hypothetical protein